MWSSLTDTAGSAIYYFSTLTHYRMRGHMTRAQYIIAFCVFLLFTPQVGAEELTIATFNAEFLTRPKVHVKFGLPFNISQASQAEQAEWTAPGFRDRKFNEAAQVVAAFIAQMNPDVLALVEVGNNDDVEELNREIAARGVTYNHLAVCDCSDSTTQQHVAVLSKFPLSDVLPAIVGRAHYDLELDEPEEETHTGISKGMRVTFQAAGTEFLLYVIHLSSEVGGHEKDAQRIAQASIVRRHYLPELNAGRNVIVAGDLNADRGDPALRRIRGRDDIWEDLLQTGHFSFFEEPHLPTRWTYQFRGIRQQLDHILISHSIKNVSRKVRSRVVDVTDSLVSDHRPFVLTLDIR